MKKMLLKTFGILFISNTLSAQNWMDKASQPNVNFFEVKQEFYNYWQNKTIEKGKGYKAFKRWEWYWEQRVGLTGQFPATDVLNTEYNNYIKTHSSKKTALRTSAANWVFHGSNTSTGGYAGIGRTNCIAFHPTIATTFWVGTPAGGLWKTTDGGSTWTTNTDNLPVLGVSDIAIDFTNPLIMYIATGDGDANHTKSVGVLKSIDGGNTWNTTGLTMAVSSQLRIRRLIIDPTNAQILYAATTNGIWKTTNGGANWTSIRSGSFMDIEFKPSLPTTLYAASFGRSTGNSNIFTSINSGTTFTQTTNFTDVFRIDLSVSSNSVNVVNAVCVNLSYGLKGVYKSTNSGASFLLNYSALNLLSSDAGGTGSGGQGFYDLAIATNPANANELFIGGVNTWKSTNGGSAWALNTIWAQSFAPSAAEVHADKHFIAYHPLLTNTVFECNDGGVYKTTNGGTTWTDLSNGLGINQMYRIGTSATINNEVICGLQDNGTKLSSGGLFYDVNGGDGMECIIDYVDNNTQYATYVYGQITKTSDNWNTSSIIADNNGTGADEEGDWVSPYVMHPTDNNTILLGKSQLYKTTDGGNNWAQLGNIPITDNIVSIAYAPSNSSVIYIATTFNIYKTINAGATWVSLGTNANAVTYLCVNPTNPLIIYKTLSGYTNGSKVFKSTDGGASWNNISGTLPNVPVNCIVYQTGSNDCIYVGTDLGVFVLDGSMTDWTIYNTGLPNVVVNELEISYNNNKLWAGTFGRGLWSSDLLTTSVAVIPVSNLTIALLKCKNADIKFTDASTNLPNNWTWSFIGGNPSSASTRSVNVSYNIPGTYTVNLTAGNSAGTSSIFTQTFVVNDLPVVTLATLPSPQCINNSAVQLLGSPTNGTYTGTGVVGSTFNPAISGEGLFTVSYNFRNADGCFNTTSKLISVELCSSIAETNSLEVSIYPNPIIENSLYINLQPEDITHANVQLYDAIGKLVLNEKITNTLTTLSLNTFSKGIYTVRIISGTAQKNVRIIKE